MKTVTLSLRYSHQRLHEPAAWLVPGCTPEQWLNELVKWDVPHQDLRLYPLPRSSNDRQPFSVLVTTDGKGQVVSAPRAIPFGRLAQRLYLPVDATLYPDISEAELGELLPADNVYLLHPSSGLVAFEPVEILRVADLMQVGKPNQRNWNLAQAGIALSSRISSITPSVTPSLREIVEGGRSDIGVQGESLSELPPSPDEPKEGMIRNAGADARRAIASAVRWLTSKVPSGATEPTWIDRVEKWADRVLSRTSSEMERRREKEMHRLMHMLEQDPDEGLRHAIPLGGEAHRGVAPPSDQLGTRNVDFNLRRLGGGAAADFWDVSWQMQQRLTQRYRELANRELNLGRHRRAAYIFAELLNDYPSAASALLGGRHWREAAVLYRDKLKNPSEAAKCLEKGGLWDEAISLHKELGNLEKAGDLTLHLERVEEAHELYRQAVDKHVQSSDHINAARILDEKLASPDESLATLQGAWPYSGQAALCLRQQLQLLARLGRHDESQQRVITLRDELLPPNMRVVGVDVLAELASNYPDQSLRALAADSTRVRVSRELANASAADAGLLVKSVIRLALDDRLLDRDGRRFLANRMATKRPTTTRQTRPAGCRIEFISSIQLPGSPELTYTNATIQGKFVYAAGLENGTPNFARASLDGYVDKTISRCQLTKRAGSSSVELFAASCGSTVRLVYQPVDADTLPSHTVFERTDQFPNMVTVCGISNVADLLLGACFSGRNDLVVLTMTQNGVALKTFKEDGGVSNTFALDPSQFKAMGNLPVPMISRRDHLFFARHDSLLDFNQGDLLTAAQFDTPITNIAASSPHTRPRIAVATETSAHVYWHDFEGELTRPVETELQVRRLAINNGGYLVLAGENGCEVFATQNRQLRFKAAASYQQCLPIAVLSGPGTNQFAIVTSAGLIRFFELK